ncbi:MAG: hypothetical protein Q7V20_22305 [Aquabacterium sp.]|uniref:hypothetical protein n=1 Tax=Aquabacterium sp. TaxID=1872578 RepID=UPI00272212B5|nr:hypothetical protein [Aquabacterium sp.]MDO9006185.1 hypothetical protein [Aquabacterium sp.]
MIRVSHVAIICALAFGANAAVAASKATASVSNISFSLTDLNLNDQVSPYFSYLPSNKSQASVTATSETGGFLENWQAANALGLSPTFADITTPDLKAGATGATTVDSVSASGYAIGNNTRFSSSTQLINSADLLGQIVLSPNSILKISGNISTTADVLNAPIICAPLSLQSECLPFVSDRANAYATVTLFYQYVDEGFDVIYSRWSMSKAEVNQALDYSGTSTGYFNQKVSNAEKFDLFFINGSGVEQTAIFKIEAYAGGDGSAAVVPEPQSVILVLVGLGMINLWVNRRSALSKAI